MMNQGYDISVLHVDDEPDFTELTVEFLEREDERISVWTATSANDGLRHLDESEIDCIVSDYKMPGMNGIEFLETVRDDNPDLPFILFTGKGSEEVASEAIRAGVSDYLQKESGTEQYELLANEIVTLVDKYRTEQELHSLRRQYTKLVEQNFVGIYIIQNGEFAYVNPRLAEIHGYDKPEEIIGMSPLELVAPDERDRVQRNLERRLTGEVEEIQYQTTGLRKDGERIDIELHGSRIQFEGDPAVMGAELDISKRKKHERRLETLIDNLPGMVYRCRNERGWPMENVRGEVKELTGYSSSTVESKDGIYGTEIIHPDDRQDVWESVQDALDSREPFQITYRILTKRGETKWVWEQGRGIYSNEGDIEALEGFITDITERKDREQKLTALNKVANDLTTGQSVEQICERTIEASKEILAFDLSVIDIEEAGVLRTTVVSEDIPLENVTDMPVEEGIAGKTHRTGESILIDDIEAHDVANPQGPYKSAISLPIGDHGVFQAVAERPESFDESDLELAELLISHTESALDRLDREQQLERQNERLDEFASVVSHDLRNPLNVVMGHLRLLQEEYDSDHLDAMGQALDRMDDLIEGLLTLTREGEEVRDFESIDLAETVEGCWSNVETADATLVAETNRTIRADQTRLKQLLENLIRNAVEHGDENVTVTIGDLDDGFYVEDDGPGIPENEREQVFEVGYSTADDGTGLGLSIVQEIAEAHGWDISVTESEAGGTRFETTGVGRVDN